MQKTVLKENAKIKMYIYIYILYISVIAQYMGLNYVL